MRPNKDMVLVTGAFDIMHLGHIKFLQHAAKYGPVWVAIDSDEKIKREKGQDRPFNTFLDRKKFLEAIQYVDHVIGFDSKDELESICKVLLPTYRLVGSDWLGKEIVGGTFCKHIYFFDRIPEFSTTRILKNEK